MIVKLEFLFYNAVVLSWITSHSFEWVPPTIASFVGLSLLFINGLKVYDWFDKRNKKTKN